MSTHILFEHPLNEKMRTWLRIEFLIQQLSQHLPVNDHATALHFFRNVGDLLDVIERGDVRTELLKELERQQRKLQAWAEVPGVDVSRIDSLRQQLKTSSIGQSGGVWLIASTITTLIFSQTAAISSRVMPSNPVANQHAAPSPNSVLMTARPA